MMLENGEEGSAHLARRADAVAIPLSQPTVPPLPPVHPDVLEAFDVLHESLQSIAGHLVLTNQYLVCLAQQYERLNDEIKAQLDRMEDGR